MSETVLTATRGLLLALGLAMAGCDRKPSPIVLSLPAPDGKGRIEVTLPELAALAPPTTAIAVLQPCRDQRRRIVASEAHCRLCFLAD